MVGTHSSPMTYTALHFDLERAAIQTFQSARCLHFCRDYFFRRGAQKPVSLAPIQLLLKCLAVVFYWGFFVVAWRLIPYSVAK